MQETTNTTLILGNCLEILSSLPADSFDLIVTDPPYLTNGGGASIAGKGTEEPLDLQFYEAWFKDLAREVYRLLRPTGAMWWTTDWRGAVAAERALAKVGRYKQKMRLAGVGVWDRGGLGMGYILRKSYENFAIAVMPEFQRIKTDEPDVWRIQWTPGDRKTGHQAEKPVALFTRAIELLGGVDILDPFMGSGTSAVACRLMGGKNYTGIEIDPDRLATARRRIKQDKEQPILYGELGSYKAQPAEQRALRDYDAQR